jgi:hypothetical protein
MKARTEVTLEMIERARERQRLVNAYHRTFDTPEGAEVLADIRAHFMTNRPAFLRGPNGEYDAHAAAIRDGNREVELYIAVMLSHPAAGDSNVEKPVVTVTTE